jgi:hypothetical protein
MLEIFYKTDVKTLENLIILKKVYSKKIHNTNLEDYMTFPDGLYFKLLLKYHLKLSTGFTHHPYTVHKFAGYINKILSKSLQCTSICSNLQPLDQEANAIQLYHLFRMTIVQKKIKFLRKWLPAFCT